MRYHARGHMQISWNSSQKYGINSEICPSQRPGFLGAGNIFECGKGLYYVISIYLGQPSCTATSFTSSQGSTYRTDDCLLWTLRNTDPDLHGDPKNFHLIYCHFSDLAKTSYVGAITQPSFCFAQLLSEPFPFWPGPCLKPLLLIKFSPGRVISWSSLHLTPSSSSSFPQDLPT